MRRLIGLLLIAAGLAATARAQGPLDDWAGIYKIEVENAYYDGKTYKSDEVLKITPSGDDRAYLEIDLTEVDGHSCGFRGLAKLESGKLTYRGPKDEDIGGACGLEVTHIKDDHGQPAIFVDGGFYCGRMYCGVRASLEQVWTLASRQPLPILPPPKAGLSPRQ